MIPNTFYIASISKLHTTNNNGLTFHGTDLINGEANNFKTELFNDIHEGSGGC